jgi:hypothetical protein
MTDRVEAGKSDTLQDAVAAWRDMLKKFGRFALVPAPAVAAHPVGSHAKDFQAAFGVGDGVTFSPIDAIGVCPAAILALSQKVESLETQLTGVEFLQAA